MEGTKSNITRIKGLILPGCVMTLSLLAGCSAFNKISSLSIPFNKTVYGNPAPGWIWVPEYYVYNGKGYKFYRGHYQKVISRKKHWKRSLRGYSSKSADSAAR